MQFAKKTVLVAGTGKSGMGSAWLLHKTGARPVLYDGNEKLTEESVRENLPEELKSLSKEELPICIGGIPGEIEKELSLVVLSPGIPVDAPFAEELRKKGLPIWGEIELAYALEKGKVLAITGTNGKTTTTTLVGEIMKSVNPSVFVVGNIGNPYTQEVLKTTDDSVTVAEISSFQLETIHDFKPAVSAVLNVTPDHLNRHYTMENYASVKRSITKNQDASEVCVLNYEDTYTREFAKECPARAVFFSSARKLENGYYVEDEMFCRSIDGKEEKLMSVHDMNLIGVHNYENVMAAIAICDAAGVPMEKILSVVKQFKAVEHRIEYVATKKGVVYYNDSKGTNPDAAIQGIKAMRWPTILIGGGYDKGNEYDQWIEAFEGKVKLFVLIGQTKEKIAECAKAHGITGIVLADSFEEAMKICVENALPGDAVLLSPACASWGMFPNYEVRGQMFKDIVNGLEE